jgi:hypothetical protein
MTAPTNENARSLIGDGSEVPLYAILERRTDGCRRIIAEFRDPAAASTCAALLRAAGSDCSVCLISSIEL